MTANIAVTNARIRFYVPTVFMRLVYYDKKNTQMQHKLWVKNHVMKNISIKKQMI